MRVPKAAKQNSGDGGLLVPSKAWDQLSLQERKLVDTFLATGNEAFALEQAGYVKSASHQSHPVFNDELIVAAIFSELTRRVMRGGVLGQIFLERACGEEDCPWGVRVEAAKLLRAPFLDRNLTANGMSKPLTEHTIDELRALVESLENQRSKDAKPVAAIEVAPASASVIDADFDFIG